jgi:hypothetical protein
LFAIFIALAAASAAVFEAAIAVACNVSIDG